jgi:hypothetical protein
MHVTEWNFWLELPTVIEIREAVVTFLQTSAYGKWTRDASQQSDRFLRFYRGSWKESESGLLPARGKVRNTKQAPLQIDLAIQASSDTVGLAITYRFCWHRAVSEKHEKALRKHVGSELRALADHIKGFYGLENSPKVAVL